MFGTLEEGKRVCRAMYPPGLQCDLIARVEVLNMTSFFGVADNEDEFSEWYNLGPSPLLGAAYANTIWYLDGTTQRTCVSYEATCLTALKDWLPLDGWANCACTTR